MQLPGIGLLLQIVGFIAASYILLHLMAVLGIFVAAGYLIWWVFAPHQTPCFFCLRKGEKHGVCRFCRAARQKKSDIPPDEIPPRTMAMNIVLLVFLTIVSAAFVFVEAKTLFDLNIFASTDRTVSYILPSKKEYQIGEKFPFDLTTTGIKKAINAVEADISFDPRILKVVEIKTDNSFATIFVTKTYNNDQGIVRIVAGVPNPGFALESGTLATIIFAGIASGVSDIAFLPQSGVLANDGQGTNILKDLPRTQVFIKPLESSKKTSLELIPQGGEKKEVLGESTLRQNEILPLSLLRATDEFIVKAWSLLLVNR